MQSSKKTTFSECLYVYVPARLGLSPGCLVVSYMFCIRLGTSDKSLFLLAEAPGFLSEV